MAYKQSMSHGIQYWILMASLGAPLKRMYSPAPRLKIILYWLMLAEVSFKISASVSLAIWSAFKKWRNEQVANSLLAMPCLALILRIVSSRFSGDQALAEIDPLNEGSVSNP